MKRIRALTATILTISIFATTATMAHASPQTDWLNAAMPIEQSALTYGQAISADLSNRDFAKLAIDGQAEAKLLDQWTTMPPAPSEMSSADRYMGRQFAFIAASVTVMNDALARNDMAELDVAGTLITRATSDTQHMITAVQALMPLP